MSVVGSAAGLLDTIQWNITVTDSPETPTGQVDNLHIINTAEGAERTFDFDGTTNTFTSIDNAGVTSTGKLTVLGTKSGDNYSTIDANAHNLFDISSTGASVELQNTKVMNAGYVANVASGNTMVLNTAFIADNNTLGIDNNGTLTLKGSNTINKALTGNGTTNLTDGTTILGAD